MESSSLRIPDKFRNGPREVKAYVAKCPACGDFGTVSAGLQRFSVIAEIIEAEVPCTCRSGDIFRALFAEWKRPVTLKGSKRPAAAVIDPEWKWTESNPAPQQISAAARGMLATIGGKR